MFLKKDYLYLEDVFALARLQTVNSDPKNKQQLNALLAIENMMSTKMTNTNEALGFKEEETPEIENPEIPLSKVEQ